MSPEDQEVLLESIDEAFGFTEHDFEDGKLIYTKWGDETNYTDVEDLGHLTLKIGKNIGDIYIDKIKTDGWVIVGVGTILHCDDLDAGLGYVPDFEGYLL